MPHRGLWLAFAVVFLLPLAGGVPVNVEVEGEIGGTVSYLEMEKNVTGVQHFEMQWYNSASVSCRSRMEFVISRNGERLDAAWTREAVMTPGTSAALETYWRPPSDGTYNATLRIHHCNDILERPLGTFTADLPENTSSSLDITAENMPDGRIEIRVEANRSAGDVVVLPVDGPAGWVFEPSSPVSVNTEGGATTSLRYDPPVWSEKEVTLQAVSVDGEHTSTPTTLTVREEIPFWEKYGTTVLIGAILLLMMVALYAYRLDPGA